MNTPVATTPILSAVTVQISPSTVSVGSAAVAVATGVDQNGTPIPLGVVTWQTSAPSVATVSATGAVTAVGVGSTNIICSSGGKSAQATLLVTAVPVASLKVEPSEVTIKFVGATQRLTSIAMDAAGNPLTGKTTTWTTSDAAVATVSTSGLVTAIKPGINNVQATVDGVIATVKITVSPISLTLTPNSVSMATNGGRAELYITANTSPLDLFVSGLPPASGFVWSSTTFSANGPDVKLTLFSTSSTLPGIYSATVRGTSFNGSLSLTAPLSITVLPLVPTAMAKVSGDNQSGTPGQPVGVRPSVRLTDAAGDPVYGATVTFLVASGGGSVTSASAVSATDGRATVGSWILGPAIGPNTLVATAPGLPPVTFTAQGTARAATITLSNTSVTLTPNQSVQLTATLRDAAGAILIGRTVQWQSTNQSVATVDGTGLITGVSVGSISVIATADGLTAIASVVTTATPALLLTKVSGDNETCVVNSFACEFRVRVVDTNNNGVPVAGQQVRWANPGLSSSSSSTGLTDASGFLTAKNIATTGTVGSFVQTATLLSTGQTVSFPFQFTSSANTSTGVRVTLCVTGLKLGSETAFVPLPAPLNGLDAKIFYERNFATPDVLFRNRYTDIINYSLELYPTGVTPAPKTTYRHSLNAGQAQTGYGPGQLSGIGLGGSVCLVVDKVRFGPDTGPYYNP